MNFVSVGYGILISHSTTFLVALDKFKFSLSSRVQIWKLLLRASSNTSRSVYYFFNSSDFLFFRTFIETTIPFFGTRPIWCTAIYPTKERLQLILRMDDIHFWLQPKVTWSVLIWILISQTSHQVFFSSFLFFKFKKQGKWFGVFATVGAETDPAAREQSLGRLWRVRHPSETLLVLNTSNGMDIADHWYV